MIHFQLPLLFAPRANRQKAQKVNYLLPKRYEGGAITFPLLPINH